MRCPTWTPRQANFSQAYHSSNPVSLTPPKSAPSANLSSTRYLPSQFLASSQHQSASFAPISSAKPVSKPGLAKPEPTRYADAGLPTESSSSTSHRMKPTAALSARGSSSTGAPISLQIPNTRLFTDFANGRIEKKQKASETQDGSWWGFSTSSP